MHINYRQPFKIYEITLLKLCVNQNKQQLFMYINLYKL